MTTDIEYSPRERTTLITIAIVAFFVLNGGLVLGLMHPGTMRQALTNPIALAFIIDILTVLGMLAYLLRKWGVARLGWGWLVFLSFAAGVAFALPIVLLWKRRAPRA